MGWHVEKKGPTKKNMGNAVSKKGQSNGFWVRGEPCTGKLHEVAEEAGGAESERRNAKGWQAGSVGWGIGGG